VTFASKRKLQKQQVIEYFPRGRPNEKITKIGGKKLKLDKEIDAQTDRDIKEEPNEPEDYTASLFKTPTKKNK
jgi:hypothetical protein